MRVPARRTPRAGRMAGQRCEVLLGAVAAAGAAPAGPQARQTIAVSLLALPAGRIRRRSLMNQGEHPATGWRNPLICGRRRTPPAPCLARRSPACLTPGRQRGNKGAAQGGRQRLPPPRREAAAGDKARFPAAMGVRNSPARPIVWAPLCSSRPRSPTAQAGMVGAGQTGLCWREPSNEGSSFEPGPCRTCPSGTRRSCPTGQVGSGGCTAVQTDGRGTGGSPWGTRRPLPEHLFLFQRLSCDAFGRMVTRSCRRECEGCPNPTSLIKGWCSWLEGTVREHGL